jgi:hypothetical protein
VDELVELQAAQFDEILESELRACPLGLTEVAVLGIDGEDAGAALRQLERVEAGVAADVERAPAAEIMG